MPLDHIQFIENCRMPYIEGTRRGDFIKELSIDIQEDIINSENQQFILTQEQFGLLIDSLPCLRVVKFDASFDKKITLHKYMTWLKNVAHGISAIEEVSLSMINPYRRDADKKLDRELRSCHYITNQILFNAITTLSIYDLDIPELKEDITVLLRDLVKFKSLKRFLLHCESYDDSGIVTDVHVSTILNILPNLEFLEFEQTQTSWIDQFNDNTIYCKLESLTLKTLNLSKKNVQFLVHQVPNLKRLNIQMSNMTIGALYSLLDPETAAQFGSYLKKRNSLSFTGISRENQEREESTLLPLWDLLRDVYDSGSLCKLHLEFSTAEQMDMCAQFFSFNRHSKEPFIIRTDWILLGRQLDPEWVHHVDFLNIADFTTTFHSGTADGSSLTNAIFHKAIITNQPYVSVMDQNDYFSRTYVAPRTKRNMQEYKFDEPVHIASIAYLEDAIVIAEIKHVLSVD